jgi:hypothetical protein
LMRRASLRLLPPEALKAEDVNLFPVIWPTSWRTMVQLLSAYLANTSYTNIVSRQFGLTAQADYGTSLILIAQILSGLATAWIFVKWPFIVQLRIRNDREGLRATLRSRVWLQWGTFVAGVFGLLLLGPWLFGFVGIQKTMPPPKLLILVAIWVFMESNVGTWTTFLSTENRIPSLWPMTIANLVSALMAYVLSVKTNWGVASVVMAPMIVGALFNYWYWPHAAARNVGLSWVRLMFEPPKKS